MVLLLSAAGSRVLLCFRQPIKKTLDGLGYFCTKVCVRYYFLTFFALPSSSCSFKLKIKDTHFFFCMAITST
jgi:hypothetical protein